MHSIQTSSATVARTLPPDALRVRAVTRRASVSASVAAVLAQHAFGLPDRDRPILPLLLTEAAHG